MLRREIVPLPEHLYSLDEWRIIERRFTPEHFARAETLYALSNGYVGMRGTFDEGRPVAAPGTFLNGFHETWPIVHAEEAYGLARTGQTIIAVPDATVLQLYVDDEPLFLPTASLCVQYASANALAHHRRGPRRPRWTARGLPQQPPPQLDTLSAPLPPAVNRSCILYTISADAPAAASRNAPEPRPCSRRRVHGAASLYAAGSGSRRVDRFTGRG